MMGKTMEFKEARGAGQFRKCLVKMKQLLFISFEKTTQTHSWISRAVECAAAVYWSIWEVQEEHFCGHKCTRSNSQISKEISLDRIKRNILKLPNITVKTPFGFLNKTAWCASDCSLKLTSLRRSKEKGKFSVPQSYDGTYCNLSRVLEVWPTISRLPLCLSGRIWPVTCTSSPRWTATNMCQSWRWPTWTTSKSSALTWSWSWTFYDVS